MLLHYIYIYIYIYLVQLSIDQTLDYSIRLVSGSGFGRYEGRLEVYHKYHWKTVCDDGWGWEESDVVCKSLGYYLGAQDYNHGARYGQGSGEILLDDVVCTGTESSLLYCQHSGVHNHNCRHSEDIGVKCASMKLCVLSYLVTMVYVLYTYIF